MWINRWVANTKVHVSCSCYHDMEVEYNCYENVLDIYWFGNLCY